MRWGRWGALLLLALLAGVFAYLNASERTSLHLGFAVLFRIPLTFVVFAAFLLGMIVMFLLGLRHDLRVRRMLRRQPPPDPHPSVWPPERPPSAM